MMKRFFYAASLGAVMAGSLLACGTGPAAAFARPGKAAITHLGRPCIARNILAGRVVRDRGRDLFAIANMNETAGMELILIDPATDSAQVYRAPAGDGAWALAELPGKRLAVGTFYDGKFMIFDLAGRRWLKTADLPKEEYIWNFAAGGDGRLYGGSYPGGKLGALDPKSYRVEDLGAPSQTNLYLRFVSPLPDGRLLCQFGYTKPEVMIFDPATKKFDRAPAELQGVSLGVAWNGYFVAGARAFRMPDLAEVSPPPFPLPPAQRGAWMVEARLSDERTLVIRQGNAIYRHRAGETKLKKLIDFSLGSVTLYAISDSDVLYGIRGQDYFVLEPGAKKLELKPIPGKSAPRAPHFIRADDRGRIWGGPTFGQTLFYHDLKSGKTINTRTVSNHGGEVYDVAVVNGICYAAAYAGGEVIRFDPAAPWDQLNLVNPKPIAKVAPAYIRPAAGITVGDDGRLYCGWWAGYGTYGGALSITDRKSGQTEVIKDPLGPQGLTGLALDGDRAILGSTISGNGLGPKKDAAPQIGVYDLKQRKLLFRHEFPGAGAVGSIVFDPTTRRAALRVDEQLWIFDPAKSEATRILPDMEKAVTSHNLAIFGRRVIFGRDSGLYALDLRSRKERRVAKLPAKIENIAAGPDGTLYVTCGADLYRVKE